MNNSYSLEKTNPTDEKRFLYRPDFIKLGLAGLVFGGLSAFAAFNKEVGSGDWKFAKLIASLGLDGHLVMKVVGFVGLALTLYVLAMLMYSVISDNRYVVLAKNSLFTPASNFNSKTHEVRFVDILNVNITDTMNQKSIRIEHKAGKIDLAQTMFKNKNVFNKCYAAILEAKQSA
ncbi:MAG TPA: hypothetical protein DIW52_22435 [Pseudomonas sp.]|jgi:hypothetical protein|nr:hypothetical protein [Pseudomonas sp.]